MKFGLGFDRIVHFIGLSILWVTAINRKYYKIGDILCTEIITSTFKIPSFLKIPMLNYEECQSESSLLALTYEPYM